jgi:chemotaxis protein histidine kinase CheA
MDRSDATAHVRQQVSELGEKFLRRTQTEAVVLRGLVERIQAGDASVLPELGRMAHKIHGSGAMFGFPAISECACEIERFAEHLMATDRGDDVDTAHTLQRLMDCIARLALAAEAPPAPAGSPPPS